jgi:hypothetical protein
MMSIETALQRLGYTKEWLDFGVITEELLLSQYQEIQTAEDDHAEHYRWKGFTIYLQSKETLTDEEIEHIFHLSDHGPDQTNLHVNRILAVLNSGLLTQEQYHRLTRYPEVLAPPIAQIYTRVTLLQAVKEQGVTSKIFERVKNTSDTSLHRALLERHDLSYKQAMWLSEHGGNKKIRTMAKQYAQRLPCTEGTQ